MTWSDHKMTNPTLTLTFAYWLTVQASRSPRMVFMRQSCHSTKQIHTYTLQPAA